MNAALPSSAFVAEVRDAVGHLYDSAYLARHPVLDHLRAFSGVDSTSAVRAFRKALLDAVEELRPPAGTPDDDPAWRPYRVIWHRFVVGRQLPALEAELALGRRQLQREQRRGLDALSLRLWERFGQEPARRLDSPEAVRQEASRLARRQRVTLAEQLARALVSVSPLAEQLDVTIEGVHADPRLEAAGDPTLVRQLIVAVLSLAIRDAPGGRVSFELAGSDDSVDVTVTALGREGQEAAVSPLTAAIEALAEGQQARVWESGDGLSRQIVVSFPPSPRERLIAFVEDNPDVVALFGRYLSGQGYLLLGVEEGETAMEKLVQASPDAILLDIMLEDLDGWEVLRQLKTHPELRHVPTVVCSVLHEPELAASLGADAYLCKPVRPARLLECLAALVAR
ncbi:MAG: hybrid sensor histidine kinase/response regulator [Anaerolineae bacterium]|nr:hybrid sensor histidine kinase/response regulator [Anaerolineae bacterium]